MIKYFYFVFFQYVSGQDGFGEDLSCALDIGYFSSEKAALSAINELKDKQGFVNYPIENFIIQKTGVKFSEERSVSRLSLYELNYLAPVKNGIVEWRSFGAYPSRAEANRERARLKKLPSTKKGVFIVNKWRVDKDIKFSEGFNPTDNN